MVDFFDYIPAIGIRHKQIRTHLLGNAQRQQDRHEKRAPRKGREIKVFYRIHAEITEYSSRQQLGKSVGDVGAALILLRRFPKIKGILRVLPITGEGGGGKPRDPRAPRLMKGADLFLGKRAVVLLRVSVIIKKVCVLQPHNGQQMRTSLAHLLLIALLTPRLQPVDLARYTLHCLRVLQARSGQFLAALALQNPLQLHIAVHRHAENKAHRTLSYDGGNAFSRQSRHKQP